MSRFKIGDKVAINQDTIDIRGTIKAIIPGSYNDETGKYVKDTYLVEDKATEQTVECTKDQLVLINRSSPKTELEAKNKSKNETIFYTKYNNIVVVGIRTEEKEIASKEMKTSVKFKGKTIPGIFTAKYTKPLRRFVIGYSICHSDDEFDMNIGVEVAKERALHKPAGELRSNNWTMLQDDQCEMLVKCEAEYIFNNIKKYINRK